VLNICCGTVYTHRSGSVQIQPDLPLISVRARNGSNSSFYTICIQFQEGYLACNATLYHSFCTRTTKWQCIIVVCTSCSTCMCMCACSDLPPSQGGRYGGFGNTIEPANKDADYWSSWSSVNDSIYMCNLLSVQ